MAQWVQRSKVSGYQVGRRRLTNLHRVVGRVHDAGKIRCFGLDVREVTLLEVEQRRDLKAVRGHLIELLTTCVVLALHFVLRLNNGLRADDPLSQREVLLVYLLGPLFLVGKVQ